MKTITISISDAQATALYNIEAGRDPKTLDYNRRNEVCQNVLRAYITSTTSTPSTKSTRSRKARQP